MRSSACCRQKKAIFSPHIHGTWEPYFSQPLYITFICNLFLVLLRPGPRQSGQVGAHGGDGGAERGPSILLALRTGDPLRHDVVHLEVPQEHRLAAPRGSDAEDHDGNTAKLQKSEWPCGLYLAFIDQAEYSESQPFDPEFQTDCFDQMYS